MKELSVKIAEDLLEIKAVRVSVSNPFTWSSGWRSPIYCDNRLVLSYPEIRRTIKQGFVDTIRQNYPTADAIAGVATAGISHGALVADEMDLPFIYVRSKPKGHGMQNLIEGRLQEDKQYVVIEDLISTGGSSLKAVQAVQAAGGKVLGVVSIFSYGFPQAEEAFAQANIPFQSLTKLPILLEKAVEFAYLRPEELQTVLNWQKAPQSWGQSSIK